MANYNSYYGQYLSYSYLGSSYSEIKVYASYNDDVAPAVTYYSYSVTPIVPSYNTYYGKTTEWQISYSYGNYFVLFYSYKHGSHYDYSYKYSYMAYKPTFDLTKPAGNSTPPHYAVVLDQEDMMPAPHDNTAMLVAALLALISMSAGVILLKYKKGEKHAQINEPLNATGDVRV